MLEIVARFTGLNIIVVPLFIAAYSAIYFAYEDVSGALGNKATEPDILTDGKLLAGTLSKIVIAGGVFTVCAGIYSVIMGLILGIVAGITTLLFYFPPTNPSEYRLSISVIGAAFGIVWPIFLAFALTDLSLWIRYGLIPGLLIAYANVLIARHCTGWYEGEWKEKPHLEDRQLEALS
ncbi:MAG: hypothetical protein M3328_00195 [Chloroflexota bacterium]|nr:hypothetical protein [Chloroflexota bacterium]